MSQGSVLIVTPFFRPNVGGVESYLNDLCCFLTEAGRRVFVVTYQPLTTRARGPWRESHQGLEVRRWPLFGHNWFHRLERYPGLEFLYLCPVLFLATWLFLVRHRKQIDVIHPQGLAAGAIVKVLGPLFRKKTVISTCAVYDFKPGTRVARAARRIFNSYDIVLALGRCSADELVRIGVDERKISMYHLWVDQTVYRPKDKTEAKASLAAGTDFFVLFIGRFIKVKGVELLLDLAARSGPGTTFCFIGDEGPLSKLVEDRAASSSRIRLVKGIRGVELIPYYQAADVLVVPSLNREAFGKVIIESLSCGTPVIGSDRGYIPSVLNEDVGRIAEPTADAFEEQISLLRRDRDLLDRLSKNARAYAVEKFGDNNARTIEKAYG